MNGGIVDMMLILYDDAKDPGTGGVVSKVIFNSFPDLERDVIFY